MVTAVIFACALGAQQLELPKGQRHQVAVGDAVVVRALDGGGVPARVAVQVELPGGGVAECGVTRDDGCVSFTPERPGHHVFAARIDGVRALVPFAVVPARARWPLALAAVPLGLALVWWNLSRARGRRDP